MEATVTRPDDHTPNGELGREYAAALARYLTTGGEAPLQEAYELGRQGLTEGAGLLEMVHLHYEALGSVLKGDEACACAAPAVARAGEFSAESMSSFEMTLRAIGDANTALHKLNETLEGEVQRIALALHDDAGQLMVAVHLSLDDAIRDLPPEVQARMSGVKTLLALVEERIRDLSHELRPAMLDHLGLVPAVEFLASNVGQRTGLRITIESTLNGKLPPKLAITLYRIVQEALTNIRRHAQATTVNIQVGRRGGSIRCIVSDNGVGFNTANIETSSRPGLGLLGIRERLNAVGGKLRIQSVEGRGTRLEITAPLIQVDHVNTNTPRRRSSSGS